MNNNLSSIELKLYKAALLHDIGKLEYRSGTVKREKHQLLSTKFIQKWMQDDTIAHIVANHHKLDWRNNFEESDRHILALLVCEADNLASSERKTSYNFRLKPLETVFNRISIDERVIPNSKYYQPHSRLTPYQNKYRFPLDLPSQFEIKKDNEYNWAALNLELEQLQINAIVPDTLLYLYKKYLWCVPSAYFMNVPDISLYEHSRLTAAIALCLHRNLTEIYHETPLKDLSANLIEDRQQIRYVLIGGGFSGIQDYLYGIAHQGALKALKGRSFWLNQAVESMARYILAKYDLPEANLIYANGGKFYLLVPYLKDSERQILEIRKELEAQIQKEYEGFLGLEFAHVNLAGKDFARTVIATKWDLLQKQLERSKNQRMLTQFKSSGFFDAFGYGGRVVQCQFTKRDLFNVSTKEEWEVRADEETQMGYRKWTFDAGKYVAYEMDAEENQGENIENRLIHPEQYEGQRIGAKIRLDKNVIAYNSEPTSNNFKMLDLEEYLNFYTKASEYSHKNEDFPSKTKRISWLNDEDFMTSELRISDKVKRTWKFYGGDWVIRDEEEENKLLDFEAIIQKAIGINRLGVLRMDVDNLGQVFAEGFGENATLSRITQLSTMLDFFFCGYLNHLKELWWTVDQGVVTQEQQTESIGLIENGTAKPLKDVLQIIYAGGDDLFIISTWDVLPDVAIWINREFQRFTQNPSNFTLSGGMSLFRVKYPLYKAAKRAGEAEKKAKHYRRQGNENELSKNAFCLFEQPMSWKDLNAVSKLVKDLYQWIEIGIEGKKLDRSIIQKLKQIYNLYQTTVEYHRSLAKERNEQTSDEALHEKGAFSNARWQACYTLARFAGQNDKFGDKIRNLSAQLFFSNHSDQDMIQLLGTITTWIDLLTRKKEDNGNNN